ncbi:MAG: NAD(P)H-hydrate dehydratase [Syntrophomonas sp.]|nr:NAD(P)H-hydrate dehydratase [Syntrophomonas sp.]
MVKILTAQEMKDIDGRASSEYNIPSLILMENAGIRTVEVVEDLLESSQDKKVLILAGKGNNGGDGLVVARHLINSGAHVDVFLLADSNEMTPDSYTNYRILLQMSQNIFPLQVEEDLDRLMLALLSCDMIVDAIYGIGFQGQMNDFDSRIVKMVNWSKAPVVAVDIPSGVEADSGQVHGEAIQASHTVSFALPKIGLLLEPGKDYVGSLSVADISIPAPLLQDKRLKTNLLSEAMIKPWLRPRHPESHKGTYGHVLLIGASQGLTGAIIMAAGAALKSGAGLVTAAVPESQLGVVDGGWMEIMSSPLAENSQGTIALEALPLIEGLLGQASACAIGPGMSRFSEASAILRLVLERAGIPVLIDADGLNALAEDLTVLKDRQVPVVLTPHPGEMARLTGKSIEEIQSKRFAVARDFAQQWGVTLVLKGNKTLIATAAGEIYLNITGNPGMATAGSGDVLCGLIAGLMAQGLRPLDASIAGVYIHGLAGDRAAEIKGQRGLVAGDILHSLPDILQRFER